MIDITNAQLTQKLSKPCLPGVVNVLSLAAGEASFYSPAILIRCYIAFKNPTWTSAGQIWQVFDFEDIKAMGEEHHLKLGDNLIIFPDAVPFSLRVRPHEWLKNMQVTVWEVLS